MAGIYGFSFLTESNLIESTELVLRKSAQQGFNHKTTSTFINPMTGIGASSPFPNENSTLISDDKNYYLQLFGELYLPSAELLNQNNFETDFLRSFLNNKIKFLNKVEGCFVFALYSKKENKFVLVNDPFGNFALHYFFDKNVILFSSQLNSIQKIINSSWDNRGLNEFLGLGFNLNGRTIYSNIKRVQPAEIVSISRSGSYSETYYVPDYNFSDNDSHYLKIIKESFEESLLKRVNNYDSIGAALTGGFDSRVTWSILNKYNKTDNVVAYTHGIKYCYDINIAAKIAAKLNLNHKIKYFDSQFIDDIPNHWEKFVRVTEGMIPVTSALVIPSWQYAKESFNTLIDSHGGALFRRQFMRVAERRIDRRNPIADEIFNLHHSQLVDLGVIKSELTEQIIKDSKQALNEYFDEIKSAEILGDKIDLFYIHGISANNYCYLGNAQMNWLLLSHPFLNIKSFNAVQKISLRNRKNLAIYKNIIQNTTPELKYFLLENMGFPAPYYGFTYLRYLPMLYDITLQNAAKIMHSNFFNKLSLKKFVTNNELFFGSNKDRIKEILLRENKNFFEIIDKRKLEIYIGNSEKKNNFNHAQLSSLITLKLFFDLFHK